MSFDESIPVAKNYQEHIYFVFKLGEPALLGSKRIAYEYACISRYPWHMKDEINNFREKHPRSIIILKMVKESFAGIERKSKLYIVSMLLPY